VFSPALSPSTSALFPGGWPRFSAPHTQIVPHHYRTAAGHPALGLPYVSREMQQAYCCLPFCLFSLSLSKRKKKKKGKKKIKNHGELLVNKITALVPRGW
jgi:hypothetical protein